MRKFLSVVLICFMSVMFFSSCGKKDYDVTEIPDDYVGIDLSKNTLKLAYSKNDSLNPLIADTVLNTQISKLVFEGLYKLDSHYEPQPAIAKSAIVTSSMINVTINDVKFSDGTPITTEDIIFSFNTAKNSKAYASELSNIVSVNSGSSISLIFNLESPDPFVLNCLDFPVVKKNSDVEYPIGSGRYSFQKDGEKIYLVVNQYKSRFNPVYRTISLESVHDSNSFKNSLVIGNTSFFYDDLSGGSFTRLNAKNVDIGINNLVYIGFNCNDEFFSNPKVRLAVSNAIDRKLIASSAFHSHARAASTPFNPDFYPIKDNNISQQDLEKAEELIKEAGIEPKSREVTLLYNSDNGFKEEAAVMVEEYLEELGFIVRLKGYNSDAYMYDIKAGSYDMYIGEVKLDNNMNLSPLFFGDSNFGINEEYVSVIRYNDFVSGSCGLMDFINSFSEDMPVCPLVYRNAVASYTKAMTADFVPCDADVFYDIDTWSIK